MTRNTHKRLLLLVFVCSLLFVAQPVPVRCGTETKPPAPDVTALHPLSPLPEHITALKEIMLRLQHEHYRSLEFDDRLSGKIFDRYLEDLDASRSFFLQSDIDDFRWYRTTLDDALQEANLKPAFRMFNRLHKRRIERLVQIIARLERGIGDMDFTRDEFIETDRKNAPWAKAGAELDVLWEKRLKLGILNLLLAEKSPEAARDVLLKRYSTQLSQIRQTNSEDAFQLFINALTRCYDPHTQYFSPRVSENFNISMSLSLEGIGAVLTREDEYTKVVRLVPAGPADKSKLLNPADRIVGVAQGKDGEMQDVVGWRLDDVVDLIRGPKDSVVRLEVLPAGAEDLHKTRTISIVRNTVKLEEQAAQKKLLSLTRSDHSYKIGVIDLPTFYLDFRALHAGDPAYKSTTRDIDRILKTFAEQQIDGLILDLRNNGGGSLQEGTALTGEFIRRGPIVQVRDRKNRIEVLRDPDPRLIYDGPLVVLVNRLSASASEILAGAIQDYQRGIIVGTRTFGKGTVQSLITLTRGQLKATLAAFYRVTGASTQNRGVLPDIDYPSLHDPDEIGESALPDALPWDTVDAVSYAPFSNVTPLLAKLKELHDERMRHDPDYRYLMQLSAHFDAIADKTRLSLSRTKRELERAELEAFRLKLENERRTAKNLPALQTLAELDTEKQAGDNSTADNDSMLTEAANILIDYILIRDQAAEPIKKTAAN